MQLKQEANTEPRKRFHLLSRLRKAVKHAEELERLCESQRVDAKTKLEAQVSSHVCHLQGASLTLAIFFVLFCFQPPSAFLRGHS